MKFSVLIPVYNTEKYLDECMRSVLAQTFQDYEVIIVDDGSTDNSGAKCASYSEQYPRKIRVIHQENLGLISARRTAIREAHGEFCVFVDSDDFVEPNLLETVHLALEQDDAIDIVMYAYYYYSDGVQRKQLPVAADGFIWDSGNKTELYRKLVISGTIDAIWMKAIRTELLRKDPIDYSKYKNVNMSEDLLQSLYPFTYARKIRYIDIPLYDYRYNTESISRCFSAETLRDKNSLHVYREIVHILPLWQVNISEYKESLHIRWFSETMHIFFHSFDHAGSKREKDEILRFNWESFLPCLPDNCSEDRIAANHLKIFHYWKSKKYRRIKLFFMKRKVTQIYKRVKNRK